NSRRIRLVLFDVDGTLIHTGGAGVKAFALTLATEFGMADGTELIRFGGRTDVSLVRELFSLGRIEASPRNFQRFFAAYVVWLEKLMLECRGGACPGVPEFYGALARRAEPPLFGLLTGNIRRGAQIKLERFGLWDKFAFGGFADDHEERDQIAAAARRRGSEQLGRALEDGEVLVIGDTPLDIRCARAIGAKALAVATGSFSVPQLEAHRPDWAVQDLSKFALEEI
ncbi:MAG TPA: HAD family hydrolase, partial [Candidatus Acidoferrum sp.]|nr:HAD family hydrolase [Candidatus Acidoferrum sp.]